MILIHVWAPATGCLLILLLTHDRFRAPNVSGFTCFRVDTTEKNDPSHCACVRCKTTMIYKIKCFKCHEYIHEQSIFFKKVQHYSLYEQKWCVKGAMYTFFQIRFLIFSILIRFLWYKYISNTKFDLFFSQLNTQTIPRRQIRSPNTVSS